MIKIMPDGISTPLTPNYGVCSQANTPTTRKRVVYLKLEGEEVSYCRGKLRFQTTAFVAMQHAYDTLACRSPCNPLCAM